MHFFEKKILCFILIFCFVFNCSIKAQFSNPYDSIEYIYSNGNLPEDTNKVNLMYDLAILAHEYCLYPLEGYCDKNFYCHYALQLAVKLKYEKGIYRYLEVKKYINEIQVYEPLINPLPYNTYYSNHKIKSFFREKHKTHGITVFGIGEDQNLLIDYNIEQLFSTYYFWWGLSYYDWVNYRRANQYFNKALKYAKEFDKAEEISLIELYMGVSYFEQKKPDSALISFNNSLEIAKTIKDTLKIAANYMNIAWIMYANKKNEEAVRLYQQAFVLYYQKKDTALMVSSLYNIGKVEIELSRYIQAERSFQKGLFFATETGDINQVIIGNNLLSNIKQIENDYKAAFKYYTTFERLKDSLLINELDLFFNKKDKDVQERIGVEITRKNWEATKVRTTTFQLERSQVYLWCLVGLCVIIGGFIIVIVRWYKASRELNRTKNVFFSIISHDLGNSFVAFKNLLGPINRQFNNLSKEELHTFIFRLEKQSETIYALCDNLLIWAKSQKKEIKIKKERFSIADIVKENILLYELPIQEKNLEVSSGIDENLKVYADRNMIDLIIRNLLNNAIKFSNIKGSIIFKAEMKKGQIEVSVSDRGAGLSEEEIEKLFRIDKRLKKPGTANEKGSGLGLILCKRFIEDNKGKIWAESEGLGKGSKFSITIPI